MSSPLKNLPVGIRNNNPGNLRHAMGPEVKTQIVDGFASFATLQQGVCSFFWLCHSYYRIQGLRTTQEFLRVYAPASENDVAAYVQAVDHRLRRNPLKTNTTDLNLDQPWRVIDFARAIFSVECGAAPVAAPYFGEWVPPFILINALNATGKWSVM